MNASGEGSSTVGTLDLGRIAHDSASLVVSRKLVNLLLSGKISVGSRLPSERELSAQLGVGRNAIRDALRPLVLLGVLETRAGSGTYVRRATSDLLPEGIEWGLLLGQPVVHELLEARVFVEVSLSRLAAERRTAETVKCLRSTLVQMEDALTPDEFVQASLAFHLEVADAAGNDVLAGLLRSVCTLIAAWIRVQPDRYQHAYCLEHEAIIDAIEAGDPSAAGMAMSKHLQPTMEPHQCQA